MKLIWGLQKKVKNQLHSPYVYDMFYLSIHMAKDLGYETVLYGTSDAIERLGEYVDETYNTDDLDYRFFDDLKCFILSTRTDEFVLLDGDVFLHKPLKINKESMVSIDTIVPIQNSGYAKDCLEILNEFEINKIIPEWNPDLKSSFSTGLIHWKEQNGLLEYFLKSYMKLRKWYLENENDLVNRNEELISDKSLSSHFVFEHLLHRIVTYYDLKINVFNHENSYYHWQGQEKFDNGDKMDCVRLIVMNHKSIGGTIKSIYDLLVKDSSIKPILYP